MNKRVGAAVVGGVAASVVLGGGVALAGVLAQSITTQSITSAGWGLTPQAYTSTDAPTLTWSPVEQAVATAKYFRVVNTGSETVNATTLTVAMQRANSNGQVQDLQFIICSGGTWDTATGLCSTNRTTLLLTTNGKDGGSAVTTIVPSAPGQSFSIKVAPTKAQISYSYSAYVSMVVAMSQTSATPTVTNS